jgi:hypothetical protein
MPEFEIVKNTKGVFVGMTEEDQRKYEAFGKKRSAMEPGEMVKVKVSYPRSLGYHRRFMAMLRFAFEQWEPEKSRKRMTYKGMPIHKDFERFRKDIVILAGYGEAKYDARGRVSIDAQSIAFDNMEEDEFRHVYAAVFEVIFTNILEPKGYTREVASAALEEFEGFKPA